MTLGMQRIVSDEGGVIVPMYADYLAAASKKIRFGNLAGNRPMESSFTIQILMQPKAAPHSPVWRCDP